MHPTHIRHAHLPPIFPLRHPAPFANLPSTPTASPRLVRTTLEIPPMSKSKRRAKSPATIQPRPPAARPPALAPAVTIKLDLGGEAAVLTLRDGRERRVESFAALLAALHADRRPAPRPACPPPPPRAPLVLADYRRLGPGQGRVPSHDREFERQLKRQARKVARERSEHTINEALNSLGLF